MDPTKFFFLPVFLEWGKKNKVHQWVKENRKLSKSDFIAFVKFYNEHKEELALNDEEMQSLRDLHEMWKKANKVYEVNFYFNMKDHHTVLNGKLLANDFWSKYIENFMRFRVELLKKTCQGGFSKF